MKRYVDEVRVIEAAGRELGGTVSATLRLALALELARAGREPAVVDGSWLAQVRTLGKLLGFNERGAFRHIVFQALRGAVVPLEDRLIGSVDHRWAVVLEEPAYAAWAVARQRGRTDLSYLAWREMSRA